jgi:hypothetical protein
MDCRLPSAGGDSAGADRHNERMILSNAILPAPPLRSSAASPRRGDVGRRDGVLQSEISFSAPDIANAVGAATRRPLGREAVPLIIIPVDGARAASSPHAARPPRLPLPGWLAPGCRLLWLPAAAPPRSPRPRAADAYRDFGLIITPIVVVSLLATVAGQFAGGLRCSRSEGIQQPRCPVVVVL